MKRFLFIAAIISPFIFHPAPCKAQTVDTVVGRSTDYYYSAWYDSCFRYQQNTNEFQFRHFSSRVAMWGDCPSNQVIVVEQKTSAPLAIRGVAVMVAINPGEDHLISLNMPSGDSLKLPEYVYLYQGEEEIPGLSDYYFPHRMEFLDSVRWDTAAPKVMALPTNAAGDSMLYCHVYEAFFDSTIIVHDTFYLMGTYNSNVFNSRIPGDEYPHYSHFPTDYVGVWDHFSNECEKCDVEDRLFFCYNPPQEEVMEVYNWFWFISGPFLPIKE